MSQINKPKEYFDGKIYLGSASAVTVTGLDFQPDLVWVKDRDNGNNHCLVDAVRGTGKYMSSDLTSAETDNATNSISAFNSDGFTTGTANPANEAASTTKGFMSWNWLASNTTASNTQGDITSTVSANTTSGFSIVSYTGNATAGATVGHGLGVTPDMFIVKVRSADNNWAVYHKSMGETKAMYLDGTSAETTDGWLNNTAPDSSVFTLSGGNYGNTSGNTHIAYCFAEKKGFSSFGSYVGNGNADGTFVYTGFKPAMIITKQTNTSGGQWYIYDSVRNEFNLTDKQLFPNLSNTESTGNNQYDFYSNGFKARSSNGDTNASGGTYIYMAFASEPLVGSNNVCATAR